MQIFVDEFCKKSDISRVKQRILKYGIISPELLNVYLAEVPCPPDRTKIVFYAKKKMQLNVKDKIQLRITPQIPGILIRQFMSPRRAAALSCKLKCRNNVLQLQERIRLVLFLFFIGWTIVITESKLYWSNKWVSIQCDPLSGLV